MAFQKFNMHKKDLPVETQQEIILSFKENKEVFSQVYDHYYEMILKYIAKRTINSEIAYDLTAETFIKAFENFHKFNWTGISIKVWLYRIAINNLKNFRRKPQYTPLTEKFEGHKDLVGDAREELKALDKALFGDEKLSKLSDAMATLNSDYQNIISLYYFSDMSQEEIGKTINRSTSAVKSMMHRAIENLKQLLSPNLA